MGKVRLLGKEWIFEKFLPGEKQGSLVGFSVEKELLSMKTSYQTLSVIENVEYGRMLFLNGFLQLAEDGEEVYHEMLVHPALMVHPKPERVLIIGGGDGGALREVLKHNIKEVTLVEIDKEVVKACKQYFPSLCEAAFKDSKATIVIGDGKDFLLGHENSFDCVILDSNDPDGEMAAGLFGEDFFQLVRRVLRKGGIFSAQTGFITDPFRKEAQENMKKVFPVFWMHRAFVRYFPTDEHSFSLGSQEKKYQRISAKTLEKRFTKRGIKTKYYSPEIHVVSSTLPPALKHEVEKEKKK